MKPELNVDIYQVVTRNSNEDDVAWVYINIENSIPDETGSYPCVKVEIPVCMNGSTDLKTSESEAIRKAKVILASAMTGL